MKSLNYRINWLNIIKLFCFCLVITTIGRASDSVGTFGGWQTVGPAGGDVRTVAIDPRDKDHLFITTLDGQVYTSYDAGNSWRFLVNFNIQGLVLDDLIIDSRDSKVIYTSGHRGSSPGGFFKSADGGASWKEAKELKNEAINAMAQSTLDPNVILVGTTSGVWISKNSGDSWRKMESDSSVQPGIVDSLAIDPRNGNTMYAGTTWRPYKSTDGGKNWRLISKGMIDDSDVFTINNDPRNPNNMFASACSGIYFSSDNGENWAKVNGIPSSARRTRDLLMHPSMPGRVYAATTEGFWMSTDYGKSGSWSLTTSKELEINSIAVHPDAPDRVYIATNNYGVMVSNDGGKNFSINNGNFTSRLMLSITPDIEQPNRFYATTNNTATGGGFIFISDDGGVSWRPSTKNLSVIRIIPITMLQDRKNSNLIYLGTNAGMYRSLDRGVSWSPISGPPPPKKAPVKRAPVKRTAKAGAKKAPAATVPKPVVTPDATASTTALKVPVLKEKVNQLIFTEDGKNGIIAATDNGLYRTYDVDKGWERLPLGNGVVEQLFAVSASKAAPETLWVGTVKFGLLVSRDNGATWQRVVSEHLKSDALILSIAANPQNPNIVYVGTIQALYMSRDGGKSWIRRGGYLPPGTYTSILINPANPNEVFVSSSYELSAGIYQSTDNGDSWKRLDSKSLSLPSTRIRTMALDPNNPNRILAGTHSGGIFRIERTPTTASDQPARPRIAGN